LVLIYFGAEFASIKSSVSLLCLFKGYYGTSRESYHGSGECCIYINYSGDGCVPELSAFRCHYASGYLQNGFTIEILIRCRVEMVM
jgi:hypothetical protein